MLSVQKSKKATEKKPADKLAVKSHQKDIPPLTKAQLDAIRTMESQDPVGPMVSSLLDF